MSKVFNKVGGAGGSAKLPCVHVQYPAGNICTCTKGTKTYTAKDTSGYWLFAGLEVGTWTVTLKDANSSVVLQSRTVSITYTGQVAFINLTTLVLFDGQTATNTNDFFRPDSTNSSLLITLSCAAQQYVEGYNNALVSSGFYFGRDVDFTGYTKLTVRADTSVTAGECVFIGPAGYVPFYPSDTNVIARQGIQSGGARDYEFNVSNLQGSYRIGFWFVPAQRYRYIRIYKMVLTA